MSARLIIAGVLCTLALFTAFDHGMRKDQQFLCEQADIVSCPDGLWWFA